VFLIYLSCIACEMSKKTPTLMHQNAEQAASELADVSILVQSQVDAGMCRDEVVEALCCSWAPRLAGLSQSCQSDKARLTSALTAGPWNEDQRKELARAVLVGSHDLTLKRKRANQKCTYFENFVPEEVWVKLKDTKQYSHLTRASLVAGVAHSIGIECPDQPTLYRMVSVVAYCEKNYDMNQDEVHKLMDKIQGFIKNQLRVADFPYIEHYPCSAQGLPKSIQDRAYGSGDLPVEVDISELSMILGDAKMRGRKKDSAPDWLQHVPDAYKGMVLQQMHANKRGRASSSCGSSFAELVCVSPLPSADLLRGNSKPAQPPIALAHGPVVSGEQQDGEAFQEAVAEEEVAGELGEKELAKPPPSIEELEERLLAGLRQKKDMKNKPAAAVPLKRPAAAVVLKPAAAVPLKRPAAAVVLKPDGSNIDMSGIFAKLRARKSTMSKKGFTSMAYHNAKTMAEKAGFSAEQAKVIAREALNKASALYDRA
jgi:hypothetical protein